MNRKHRQITAIVLAGILGASTLLVPGCARLAGKPDAFKRAVYLSSSAVGLEKLNDAISILERANHVTPAQSLAAQKVVLGAAKTYVEVDRLLFTGDAKGAAAKINAILDALGRLQDNNAFNITNEESRAWFFFIIELTRTGVTAFANFINKGTPDVQLSLEAQARLAEARKLSGARAVPGYILELAALVLAAQSEINNLLFLPTTEDVRAVGIDIVTSLIMKLEPTPATTPAKQVPTPRPHSTPIRVDLPNSPVKPPIGELFQQTMQPSTQRI